MTRKERIQAALEIAAESPDGEHHKQWVIDQMVRALLGKRYLQWRNNLDEWSEGIPP